MNGYPSDSIGYPLYSISTNHIDVCVRCGSGCHDDDGLLSCQICCQPFHWFCVGMSGPTPNHTPFTCSRCVSCAVCGLPNEVILINGNINYNHLLELSVYNNC